MPTHRRRRFLHGHVAWMLGCLVVLAVLESLTLELFFVASLIGLLVVIELTAPVEATPRWRRRLRWLVAAGLLAFVAMVVRRILAIIPPGVL